MGYFIVVLLIAAALGLIPATIAKNKGHSFGLWWFYGWMIFIAAIIHVQFIPDKNAPQTPIYQQNSIPCSPSANASQAVSDELKKYKELLDCGVISEDEFASKKEQLLKQI